MPIADYCVKCNHTRPCNCDVFSDKESYDNQDLLKTCKQALNVALAFIEKSDGRITEVDVTFIINDALNKIKQVER